MVVSYVARCGSEDDPESVALEIACEQTVELPLEAVPEPLRGQVVGRVERASRKGEDLCHCRISYDATLLAADLTQALNLLFGNISMKSSVGVMAVEWPALLLDRLPGPRFGSAGLRRLCGAPAGRPLTCAALKPVGLGTEELAQRAQSFARGGIDIVKDDHSLADQAPAPFRERVSRCQEAVGDRAAYFPNVTAPVGELEDRVAFARSAGCKGVLVSPMVIGLDVVRRLAEEGGMAILGHPALAGGFLGTRNGMAHEILLGQLFRMAGCDGVIYPEVGGRFRFTLEECDAIRAALGAPLGSLLAAMPVPAGGLDAATISEWAPRFGSDTVFLIGGSLYTQEDLEAATRAFAERISLGRQSVGGESPIADRTSRG